MKYLKKYEKYGEYEDIHQLKSAEYEDIHRKLNELFTSFRENVSYLKNIWFKLKYNEYDTFELEIIWFYSHKTTKLISAPLEYYKPIYKFTKQRFNLLIENHITDSRQFIDTVKFFKNLTEIIEKFCIEDIKQYLEYYPNLHKILKKHFIILDYDKFLKEFEQELKESSLELDILEYKGAYYSYLEEETMKIVTIEQVYMPQKRDVYLNFKLNVKSDYFDEYTYADTIVDAPFINYRNKVINKIGGLILSKNEVYNLIDKLEYILSDEFKEEWELKNSASKFNM